VAETVRSPTIASDEPAFPVLANLLCLDLVNTEVIAHGRRVDLLRSFEDLMRWARRVDLASDADHRAALDEWGGRRAASATLREALALRHALRSVAEALAERRSLPEAVVPAINHALAAGASVLRLERRSGAYVTSRHVLDRSALTLLAPVGESAAWLLEQGDHSQVRRCENPACILFFYDTTKNKRRRWCAMDACGSRAKAATYYRRTRAARAAARRAP